MNTARTKRGKTGVASLSAHRNTRDRRRRHDIAKRLAYAARAINDDKQVTGFVVVAWTNRFDGRAVWHFDDIDSSGSTPERVKQILLEAISSEDG